MITETVTIHKNQEVIIHVVKPDVNGNSRFVIWFMEIAADYKTALEKIRKIGGKPYRAKRFGGGFVFQSNNIISDLEMIIPRCDLSNTEVIEKLRRKTRDALNKTSSESDIIKIAEILNVQQ